MSSQEKCIEKIILIVLLLIIVISETIAQYCIKRCRLTKNWKLMIIAIFLYIMVCICLYYTYNYKSMGMVHALWSCLGIVTVITVGIIFFHEKITKYDILGLLFILFGFILIFVADH